MRKKQILLLLLCSSLASLAAGCAAVLVGAGAGTAIYVTGDLKAAFPEDINTVYEAAQKAVEQLELKISSKTKDALSATIIARDAKDKKITIKLTATAEKATNLAIRVGIFGNETKSRLIYEQIQKNLKR